MLSRAVLHGRRRAYEPALGVLDEIANLRQDAGLGPNELLEKGRLLDQMGRFDDAFAAFVEGKRLVREVSGTRYMADHAANIAARLKGFFTANRMKITPRATVRTDTPQPLFIVGFPRSGTTLTEQTLSAHHAISAGDELPFIADITGLMQRMLGSPLTYPDALSELWMGDQREGLDNLRDYYLQRARQIGIMEPGKRWFTDKMPLNETHLGLIALLFPASPIIHVIRHPLDVVTSVFSNQLTHGFYCAYELESAARHYALIADLIAHYRSRNGPALSAGALRGHGRQPGAEHPPHAGVHRRGVRRELPAFPREQTLRPHRQLRPGDRKALRSLALSIPPLPQAAGSDRADPAAGDRPARLHRRGPGGRGMSLTIDIPTEDTVKLAAEHEAAGRLDQAEAVLDRMLAKTPGDAEAIHLKGVLAIRQGRVAEGAALMERSLELGPVRPYYLRNLCEVYRTLGRYDEALESGRKAAAGDPNDPICHANLSVLHYERGEPEQAIAAGERALAINNNLPGAHFGLAEALLLRGQFERGWEEYEWRFRMPGVPTLMPIEGVPQWDGKPLESGRLMLIADQGFGDGIQFCRYIPWAAERCAEVVVAASKELQPLIGQIPGISKMFDRWEVAPACAAFLPLSGLPRLHGTRIDNVPAQIPYLRPEPARVARWKARVDELAAPGHRRIGLVWAGRPTHKNDRNRSVALSRLGPLTSLSGVTYVSLQKGPAEAQIGGYFGHAPLINLGPEIDDFVDSMAVMDGLDLVVTVDTAVGHLAGAMGKRVFDHAALCARLALAGKADRHPLVPDGDPVPPADTPRLAGGDRRSGGGDPGGLSQPSFPHGPIKGREAVVAMPQGAVGRRIEQTLDEEN